MPQFIALSLLLVHRIFLTKYKYSSRISFEDVESTILESHNRDSTASPPARLPLNNFSILKNLADMNASTGEFLDTFDGVVNFIEGWMNEPPEVTYTKWLALVFSLFAVHFLTSLFFVADILAATGTILWILSHASVRNFVLAWIVVLTYKPKRRPEGSHHSHRAPSIPARIKLFLFRVVHYFLSIRLLDAVFHDPQQSIQDFDLDPSMFE